MKNEQWTNCPSTKPVAVNKKEAEPDEGTASSYFLSELFLSSHYESFAQQLSIF